MPDTILLVEDDQVSLRISKHLLEQNGFEVVCAENGEAAVEKLSTNDYDTLLIDLYMPGMDGFALLEWLRANKPDAVSIVLSSSEAKDDVVKAMRNGAFDYISKPIADNDVLLAQVRRAIEHKHLHDENATLLQAVQEKNEELESRLEQLAVAHSVLRSQALAVQANLHRAQSIQEGLLPVEVPFNKQVSMAAYYRPASHVGGDFYDIFHLDNRRLGFYVADTTGHGISAALLTVYLKFQVQVSGENGKEIFAPGRVLRTLNERLLASSLGHDLFVSIAYVLYNVESRELHFSTAGHPPLFLRHGDGRIEPLRTPAPALGINPNVNYSTSARILGPGDILYVYTDGVTDMQSADGQVFGKQRLTELVSGMGGPPRAALERIAAAFDTFRDGAPFPDDTTVFIFEPRGQQDASLPRLPVLQAAEEEGAGPVPGVKTASEGGCSYFSVAGSGTWKESQALIETVQAARDRGDRTLVLDFEYCTHLDSTFMGTLHNLCIETETPADLEVEVQHIPRDLLANLSELGLTSVLLHFRQRPRSMPDEMSPLPGNPISSEVMGQLLLSAHEALAEADPKNADRFAEVLKCLRDQARQSAHRQAPGQG